MTGELKKMNLKQKVTTALAGLVLATGLAGCPDTNSERYIVPTEPQVQETIAPIYTLTNGVTQVIQYGPEFLDGEALTYRGMNTESTFSVSEGGRTAVNTYFPIDATQITLNSGKWNVMDVDANHLAIQYVGENAGN